MSNFSRLPSVSISRSKFKRNSQHKTSIKLGEITPIYLDEVLPGDTHKIDLGALIRMSTPVTPIMDNIYFDIYAFFVPNRLCWTHWKEFMGENNSSAGIYSGTAYTIPAVNLFTNGNSIGCLGDHYGLPIVGSDSGKTLKVSTLPGRGYRLIYNRWFRDQNLISPVVVSTTDTATSYDSYNISLYKAAKKSDYFTRSLPYVQKGSPVTIPLGDFANLKALPNAGKYNMEIPQKLYFGIPGGSGSQNDAVYFGNNDSSSELSYTNPSAGSGNGESTLMIGVDEIETNIVADLRNATAATINQLRFAFQYQKMLEKDALYGTRYWEIIKSHYGVTAPDASLQDPQFLGHMKINVNVDQVVQTTGINQATPASNTLGSTAAVSVTAAAGNLLTFSAVEHGFIHILAVARHDQTYGQGVERFWSRKERTDFYFPVFANLGAQAVLKKEIYAQGTSADDEAFSYQESWAEYRYKNSKCTGLLNPSVSGSLGYWTLANNFAVLPTLGQTFIEQDRNALARCLQSGSTGPDFICDFAFQDIAVRPMPMYSIPGLIDHH